MNRRPRILAAVALVTLIAAVATRGFGLLGPSRDGGLTLYGNVDIREVDMAFRLSGRIASIPVEEGDHVKQGQLLATLDAAPVKDRVAAADAAVARAKAALARTENGNREQDIAQARARFDAARAARNNAAADYERRESLVRAGAISKSQWDQTATALRQADARLAEAEEALSLLKAGSRAEDIAAARAELASANAQRASAGTDLGDTRLAAPVDGTVVTRAMEPGAIAQPGQTVMTIAISRPMRVRAYIAEPDLGRIAPGMKVTVKTDGNDKLYNGTIGYISPRAEFTPKAVETENLRTDLVYRLRIIVSDPDDALRQGQPVTVAVPGARPAGD